MASEYLKKKYQDVKPEPKIQLTPAQKRKNWWHYHKWHVLLAALLLLAAGDILRHVLGIGQIRPDYCFAYVGAESLPEDTEAALEAALSGLGEDLNGDGRAAVEVRQYVSGGGSDSYLATSAYATLLGDIENCESFFFLLDNPVQFQQVYQVLCYPDGTLPPDGNYDAAGTFLPWSGCPVLAGLDLGRYRYAAVDGVAEGDSQNLLARLYVARRGFWPGQAATYPAGCAKLWTTITAGAAPQGVPSVSSE